MLMNNNGTFESSNDNDVVMSSESFSQILEAMILENLTSEEIEESLSDFSEVRALTTEGENEHEVLTEKTIVRLDKAAKLQKAKSVAVYTVAKEKNDPLFKRLLTLWRAERFITAKLTKKYGNEAMRRAKKVVNSSSSSRSKTKKKVVDRVALKARRQLNALKDTKAKSIINKLS